jgi:LTXXQ motif family protein
MSTFASATRVLAVPALLTALAFGLPTAASAQTTNTVTPGQSAAPATAPAAKTKTRHTRGGVEQHIAELHQKLKITPDQEAQWNQVADVMRQNAASVAAAIKDRAASAKTMNAVDNLQSYEKIAEAHEQGIEKLIPPFQALYSSMSDAQKKNADTVFRASAQRRASRAKKAG